MSKPELHQTTPTTRPLSHSEHLAATSIAVAVVAIRNVTADPRERERMVRQFSKNMLAVVNDPKWGVNT